jgi:hypothetical protein
MLTGVLEELTAFIIRVMSVNTYRPTKYNIPEDSHFYVRLCETLKSLFQGCYVSFYFPVSTDLTTQIEVALSLETI